MSRTHRSHAQWLELFEAFKQSGQTQAAFCTERDVNPAYFVTVTATTPRCAFADDLIYHQVSTNEVIYESYPSQPCAVA